MSRLVDLRMHAFGAQKNGMRPSDWEDSAAFNRRSGRMAIADGASSSYAAQQWSRLLVAAFVTGAFTDPHEWDRWIGEVRERWGERPPENAEDVPAYLAQARSAAARVSYSTLVGAAVVHEDDVLRLRVTSVGDSCLFVVRNRTLVATVPDAAMTMRFDSHPPLLGSSSDADDQNPVPSFTSIDLYRGDSIFIASDALAEQIRDMARASPDIWEMLVELRSEQFVPQIDSFRSAGMANDDVVLLRCCVDGAAG